MNKVLYPVICILLSMFLWGIDVDEPELTSVKLGSVEFLNYEGPHLKIETREQIAGIGTLLGSSSGNDVNYAGRYRVLRIVDENSRLLNADIFIIEAGAMIDHIENVRRIITAYMSKAYGYSENDASVLARFCSYYNAVYRGNLEYFSTRYHAGVLGRLDSGNAGISPDYREWPGKTRMLIPIKAMGRIDADIISDDAVVETLREEEDRGVPERIELVEFKEKELDTTQEEIDRDKVILEKEEVRIREEQHALEEDKAELEEQRDSLTTEEIETREESIAERETVLEEQKRDVAEKKAEVVEKEEEQRERVEKLQEERAKIAQDQEELLEQQKQDKATTVARGKNVLFLKKNSDDPGSLATLILIDSLTGREIKKSPISTIHSPWLQMYGQDIVAIAGEQGGNRAIRLVFIDPQTLEMKQQCDSEMHPGSYILVAGDFVYAVIREGPSYRVGKFDRILSRVASSRVDVLPNTWLKIEGDRLYAQTPKGVISTDASTMKE